MPKKTEKAAVVDGSDCIRSRPRGIIPSTRPLPGRRIEPERYADEATAAEAKHAMEAFAAGAKAKKQVDPTSAEAKK